MSHAVKEMGAFPTVDNFYFCYQCRCFSHHSSYQRYGLTLILIMLGHWDVAKAGTIITIILGIYGERCLCIYTENTGDANKVKHEGFSRYLTISSVSVSL